MRKFTTGNSKGTTLVELMVILGIIGIIALGVLSLFQTMQTAEVRTNTVSNVQLLKNRLSELALNSKAWQNTVAVTTNSELACVRSNPMTACTGISSDLDGNDDTIEGYTLQLYDSGGTATSNLFTNSRSATDGFTAKGVRCTTYNGTSGSGTDDCPIRYNVTWKPMCPPSPSPCINPPIRVLGKLKYNPSSTGLLSKVAMNANNYNFAVTVGSAITYEPFTIYYPLTTGSEGSCSTSGWTTRRLTRYNDPTGYGSFSLNATSYTVTFQPGTYQCQFSAPAFQVRSFKVRLYNVTTGAAQGNTSGGASAGGVYASGYAGQLQMARAQASIIFTITTANTFRIEQTCQTSLNTWTASGLPAGSTTWDLGFAAPDPGGSTYTGETIMSQLVCSKVN